MKVWHLNKTDTKGGAARAASRIHECLVATGTDSTLYVDEKTSNDRYTLGPSSRLLRAKSIVWPHIATAIHDVLGNKGPDYQSLNVLPSNWSRRIRRSNVDVVHLHWGFVGKCCRYMTLGV